MAASATAAVVALRGCEGSAAVAMSSSREVAASSLLMRNVSLVKGMVVDGEIAGLR